MTCSRTLVVLLGVVTVAYHAYAAGRPYQCKAGVCADISGYERMDVCGCTDWCHIDRDESGAISRDELYKVLIDCLEISKTGLCQEWDFVRMVMAYGLPICESEIRRAYKTHASLDGDPSSASVKDADLTYNFITQIAGGDDCLKRAREQGKNEDEVKAGIEICNEIKFGTIDSYKNRQDPVSLEGYTAFYHNHAFRMYADDNCDRPFTNINGIK